MTLPAPLASKGGALSIWRLDEARFARTWDSGEGAFLAGGRWNSRGVRAVYCAADPATATLEVAVHKGFKALDLVPHVLTEARIEDPGRVHVVNADEIPNSNWLHPGIPSAGQQAFGDDLLSQHAFVMLPSVVAPHSWNVIFVATNAAGAYRLVEQEPFAFDTRLNRSD